MNTVSHRSARLAGLSVVVVLMAAAGGCQAPAAAPAKAALRSPLDAFPGAEGAGRHALGGRGGVVHRVTHLGDDGPGSLRAAVEAKGARTVVFAVSGTILLKKPLRVENGRLTIAGQTAPGDGITLRGQPFEIAADDVVVRYIRSRLGDEARADGDAMGVVAGRRIVYDHVSASWSTDESLSVSARFDTTARSFDEVTVQWSVIAESLNLNAAKAGQAHGFGSLLRAGRGARVSMHHNLWAHHLDRMPRPGNWLDPVTDPVGGLFDFRSNVFYNWGRGRAGYNLDRTGTRSTYNFIDNAYVRGPQSKGAYAFEESSPNALAFFAGNTMDGIEPADPYALVLAHREHLPAGLPAGYKLATPIQVGAVAADPAPRAYERVLAGAGAALVRDAVDLRIVEQVRSRSGRLIDSQREVGGWPALQSAVAPLDSDGDGIPDVWERAHGLDSAHAEDAALSEPASGFTWLEVYLAELAAGQVSPLTGAPTSILSATERTQLGWAAEARGGRGGRILRVTHLGASGPGSLREAVEFEGPRIVVFEVGGVIDMAGAPLAIRHPFLTIAGQTAPPPGITVVHAETSIDTHDVIVQHLAFRPGEWGRPKRAGGDQDGLSTLGGASRVIVDHCSFSWATDENLSASGPRFDGGERAEDWRRHTSHDITFSHNLIYEGLSHSVHQKGEHSKGSLIHDNASGILLFGNVYVSNRQRNALFKGGTRSAMVNNLVFNPGDRAIHYNLVGGEWKGRAHETGQLTLIGNVMRHGPDSEAGLPLVSIGGQGDVALFMADNLAFDRRGAPVPLLGDISGGRAHVLPAPSPDLPAGLRALPAGSLEAELPARVGARPWNRDPLDRRVLDDMARGIGRIINDENQNPLGTPRREATRRAFRAEDWDLDRLSPRAGWAALLSGQ
ncbi:hypothetical protein [Piscinibacter sp.]|uniref:hypothetical protein n=1 Tax=Piscinibacter sp. TaxID=1903157 RepID=UPI0025ED4B2E|nr:hypothetical protein [Piscinibacter sp.]